MHVYMKPYTPYEHDLTREIKRRRRALFKPALAWLSVIAAISLLGLSLGVLVAALNWRPVLFGCLFALIIGLGWKSAIYLLTR